MCVEATNVMKPLNVIQIGKKYTDEIKTFKCYQNRVARKSATLSKSRTQISATVLFRKNKRFHFFSKWNRPVNKSRTQKKGNK